MAGFNKILLMGNLTRDPQLSYTPSQTAVVDFGIATSRRWKDRDGNQREDTCFVDCSAFGRMAENINKYFTKGRPIFVEGRLTYDTWTAQDGTKRSKHRVTIDNFHFLPGTGGGPGQSGPGGRSAPSEQSNYGGDPGRPPGPTNNSAPDDEIPF